MSEKRTAKAAILDALGSARVPVAVHELSDFLVGYSENSLATRLSELHAEGKVVRRKREGQAFNEWRLATIVEQEKILKSRPVGTSKPKVAPGVVGHVVGVQGCLTPDFEAVVVEVPKGRFSPGQTVRLA